MSNTAYPGLVGLYAWAKRDGEWKNDGRVVGWEGQALVLLADGMASTRRGYESGAGTVSAHQCGLRFVPDGYMIVDDADGHPQIERPRPPPTSMPRKGAR